MPTQQLFSNGRIAFIFSNPSIKYSSQLHRDCIAEQVAVVVDMLVKRSRNRGPLHQKSGGAQVSGPKEEAVDDNVSSASHFSECG